jgi:hypothetical protein
VYVLSEHRKSLAAVARSRVGGESGLRPVGHGAAERVLESVSQTSSLARADADADAGAWRRLSRARRRAFWKMSLSFRDVVRSLTFTSRLARPGRAPAGTFLDLTVEVLADGLRG